jgi:hypothetical protein
MLKKWSRACDQIGKLLRILAALGTVYLAELVPKHE